jgi:hypothetical protein
MSYGFKTNGVGFAEQRYHLSFTKERPNFPNKDSFRPEIEGGLFWQRAAKEENGYDLCLGRWDDSIQNFS